MSELSRKRKIRGGHRSSATKTLHKAEDILNSATPDKESLAQLKLTITEKLEVLKLLDAELLNIVEEEAVGDEIDQSDEFKKKLYRTLIRIDQALAPTHTDPTLPLSAEESSHRSTESNPPRNNRSQVKLPKLTIPPFKGELTTWMPFWESYQAAIHNNEELADTDKFNYLRSLLQREALDAIAGLALTAANYKEAVLILEKRFGNKQQIIAKHMDALLNIETVTSQHNLKSLRRLYDTIENHTRSLKSLGVNSDSYGGILVSVLFNKLPQELQLLLSRNIEESEWKLDGMMKIIEKEIQARERTVATPTPFMKKAAKEIPTAATLFASRGSDPTCTYCQQAHSSNSCKVVPHFSARKQVLQRAGRCFICLRRGHISRECRSNLRCSICRGRHHISICSKASGESIASGQFKPQQMSSTQTNVPQPSLNSPVTPFNAPQPSRATPLNTEAPPFQSTDSHSATMLVNSDRTVLLQTAQAIVFNPCKPNLSLHVRIVFDCGSQWSYVTKRVKDELSLATQGEQPLTIMTFGSDEEKRHVCESVRLSLVLRSGLSRVLELFTVPLICEPLSCQPVTICQGNFNHLAGLDLADPSDGSSQSEIDILIGSDLYWELVTGDIRRGQSGPVAIKTRIGWVLSGTTSSPVINAPNPSTCLMTHALWVDGLNQGQQAQEEQLKAFWELESFGISNPDESVHDKFGSTIRFVEGRYEVELPWKEAHPFLPDNYQLCVKRLNGLIKRLKHNPAILREYDSIIRDQIKRGIVEPVAPEQVECSQRIHYLPHHAVLRHDKETTKVRVVYDASARTDGPSLNDCLYTGPKFNPKILDILLRFRMHRVAVIADIEKAFLMVSMAPKDRDVLRFLWFEDAFVDQRNIIELRFTRVVFGISSSPYLLNATIRHHLEKYKSTHPILFERICKSIYVDDLVSGADNEEQAHELFLNSKQILSEGGFNLRKFSSNSTSLNAKVDTLNNPENPHGVSQTMDSDETFTDTLLDSNQRRHTGEQKVLGIHWNTLSDQIIVSLEEIATIAQAVEPTKRNIVSLVGKIYDPLGFLAPTVIQFKMFLQELSEANLRWDEALTQEFMDKWQLLKSGLDEGCSILIPRCYLYGIPEHVVSYKLCGFCDASLKAYAGVVYLLLETTTGLSVRFVAAKTRVSPLRRQTIPRLELLSCLLLARLLTSITQSLETEVQLTSPHCFTDSTVALCWIKGINKIWKPFVQNRAKEIRELTPPDLWRHCSGKNNPADIPSRGAPPLDVAVNSLWRNGPNWLREGSNGAEKELEMPEECLTELRVKDRQVTHGLMTTEDTANLSRVIDLQKFSSLDHLLSVTTMVLKFCAIALSRIRPERTVESQNLRADAERLWILEGQQIFRADKNFKIWQQQLDLFHDGSRVLRCRGRIQNAAVPYSTKHPILLHKNHHFSVLVVRKAHISVLHNGVKETLTQLRAKYWIIKARSFVKSVIYQCNVCRRHEGKPYSAPAPPPLPSFRVEEAPPFSYIGVDFAGPLYIRSDNGAGKVWICLYTCCVVRAVHLELVSDLSTHAFLRCFKRFTARRGLPSSIISDNGKTFKAAAKILRDVKWIFNAPKAPWWGGIFERMIRCTKRCLRKIIGQAKLSHDELLTAITEVEMVLNARPLSYVSANDLEEPLTPSHLMVGRRLMNTPDYTCLEIDGFEVTPDVLTRRAKYLSATVNRFWERWRKEYLVGLREAHSHQRKNSCAPRISVGDVVIIHSDDQPRGLWKLGIVEKLAQGQDGETRAATLRVSGQGRHAKYLTRPVQRIYPIEMAPTLHPDQISLGSQNNADMQASSVEPTRRSKRAAAASARDRLSAQSLMNDND